MGSIRIDVPLGGGDPYSFATQNLAPEIMTAGGDFSRAVYSESKLSLREFEGLRIRIADINGCKICIGFRAARDARAMFTAARMEPARIVTDNGPAPDEAFYAAVNHWRGSDLFTPRERIAIEFAERFAQEPKVLSADEDFWSRAKALFSDAEIVDMAHCAAAFMGLGRVAHVLGFDNVCLPYAPEPALA